MNKKFRALLVLIGLPLAAVIGGWWPVAGNQAPLPAAAQPVDYQRDIKPVLTKKCLACHGPDETARQMNLRLDTRDGAIGKNGGYAGIVPGASAESRVLARITDPTRPMPPAGERLSAREVELIRNWIDQGANYSQHWAFEKPARPAPPADSEHGRPGYYEHKVSSEAVATLKAGRNALAIRLTRLRDQGASQVFDAGLFATRALDFSSASAQDASRAAWVVVANVLLNLDETLTRR